MSAPPLNEPKAKPRLSVDSTSTAAECNIDGRPRYQSAASGKERAPLEKPKQIATHDRKLLLKRWMLVHFPPAVVMYLGLPLLYFDGPSWNQDDIQLGWFLFAGKVYETLVITSVSDILMYYIRYALTRGSQGVPFGVLTAPYQITQPLYLFGKPYIASWMLRRSLKNHGWI